MTGNAVRWTVTAALLAGAASLPVLASAPPVALSPTRAHQGAGATVARRGAVVVPAPVVFHATGAEQSYVVPPGVALLGAVVQGGWGGSNRGVNEAGAGLGGLLRVQPRQVLYIEVGRNGRYDGGPTFGGGGAAGLPPPLVMVCKHRPCNGDYASSGGGASDVRTCSLRSPCSPVGSDATRLIVAGGGAGDSGGGNGVSPQCGASPYGGNAVISLLVPGGKHTPAPVPLRVPGGIVVPGLGTFNAVTVTTKRGVTPAAGGSAIPGSGGSQGGCSGVGLRLFGSVAGRRGAGPDGGAGGSAATLPPFHGNRCWTITNSCSDAGPGGGGGGGYTGGGGGATGLDFCTSKSGPCNAAGGGEGGAAGSSFVATSVLAPRPDFAILGTGVPLVRMVPVVEVAVPAAGARYAPGAKLDARWLCVAVDPPSGLGVENCTATVPNGEPISTSPGTHRFTVRGIVPGNKPVSVSVTYSVR